jgi:hypothetical protein
LRREPKILPVSLDVSTGIKYNNNNVLAHIKGEHIKSEDPQYAGQGDDNDNNNNVGRR